MTVYGRAQGPDWVFVKTSDNMAGWMNSVGLEYLGEFSTLPIYQVPFALQLKGHVWLADKTPANLIGVALQPVNNTNPELMDNVMTGADGAWYVYLPLDSRGSWVIGPNSYGCPKDQPNGECPTPGQFPDAQEVTLPDAANVNIEFNLLP